MYSQTKLSVPQISAVMNKTMLFLFDTPSAYFEPCHEPTTIPNDKQCAVGGGGCPWIKKS